ncbi:MAG: hypothetical protein MZW92_77445 [Comamonadaceae bacterium]|nr:hypothetical protein [Comamonadaceae bacterium]
MMPAAYAARQRGERLTGQARRARVTRAQGGAEPTDTGGSGAGPGRSGRRRATPRVRATWAGPPASAAALPAAVRPRGVGEGRTRSTTERRPSWGA